MPRIIIFDDGLGRLGPMTQLRAAFEVRTGMLTTAGRIAAAWPRSLAGYWVPEHLVKVVQERANAPVNHLPDEEAFLCVNGRWALPDESLKLGLGEATREEDTDHVVAAHLRRADAEYFLTTGQLHERVAEHALGQRVLYRYPWEVLSVLEQTMVHDMQVVPLIDAKVTTDETTIIGQHPVGVHNSATLYPNVVLDAEHGPIMIHDGAVVRPGAVICGPCSIGREATIVDRTLIKPKTVIGPVCKIGGEVGGTIFQGYANKAHDGHLGDSWVGKWANFGAGTTNSNLLNTYSEVVMRLDVSGPVHRTGMMFLGAIVGDHVKFAINTRLMTGSVIGAGAMIASTAAPPMTVRPFAWITDRGEQTFRFEKFLQTAQAVMSRRGVSPTEAYADLLRQVHEGARNTSDAQ